MLTRFATKWEQAKIALPDELIDHLITHGTRVTMDRTEILFHATYNSTLGTYTQIAQQDEGVKSSMELTPLGFLRFEFCVTFGERDIHEDYKVIVLCH